MKIHSVSNVYNQPLQAQKKSSLSFGDAYSTKQEEGVRKLSEDIKREQGYQNGINVVKMYAPALPSNAKEDTGIGKITSKEAAAFYRFAKTYYGASAIKFLPMGQLTDKQVYSDKKYMGAYNRGALAVGEDVINPYSLTTPKYGNILSKKDVDEFFGGKKRDQNKIDFETTLGYKNQQEYPVNSLLQKAFDNFKNDEKPNAQLKALRAEFEAFKTQKEPFNADEIYTRLALYPYLRDYGTAKVDFFIGFDSDPKVRAKKMPEYNRLKEQYKNEIEFYKFKQFLAHKTVKQGIDMIHAEGMDAIADCAYGFSWPEEQMFPDAFLKDRWGRKAEDGRWGLPVLNYYNLMDKEDSPTHQLLRAKVAHYLQDYDGIRFDVGWAYLNPTFHFGDNQFVHLDTGTKVTDFFEKIAREVKGNDFDQRKLMYECDADGNDFNLWNNVDRLKRIKGMAILSTEYEKNDNANIGWGNAAFLRETLQFDNDDLMVGTCTHDGATVLECADDNEKSNEQIGALMRIFKLRPEDGVYEGWKNFKDAPGSKAHYRKYTAGRFAELATLKNNFVLYTDLLGRRDRIDYHTGGVGNNSSHDYKNRLERNWEENYHRAIQDGVGCNWFEAQKFRMEHDGTAERCPELYSRTAKYAAYLNHNGGIYTREQADNSARANLDIDSMTLEEIENL